GYGHKRTTATGNNGQKALGIAVEARTAGADAHICPILQYSNTSILPLHQFPRCLSVRARSRPFVVRSQSLTPSRPGNRHGRQTPAISPPRSPSSSYFLDLKLYRSRDRMSLNVSLSVALVSAKPAPASTSKVPMVWSTTANSWWTCAATGAMSPSVPKSSYSSAATAHTGEKL